MDPIVDDAPDRESAAELVVGAGTPEHVAILRYYFAERRWEWSPEAAALYGYDPGDNVTPTTELLVGHQHPDDRGRVEAEFVSSVRDEAPFSSRHRIIDAHGRTRPILIVSRPLVGDDGATVGTEGYVVDLSDTVAATREEIFDEVMPELLSHRMVIEQAKGALMLAYGLSADHAFRVLVWRSQETNIRVRDLAARLVERLSTIELPAGARTRVDHVLLTLQD
ncbi:PAS and ANTAR domain-containing protein [Nocardia sp. CDC153]|uniref:PAS and ANTAR domain-containing protein n=1 Tax=Nocardia sp. CDC153 TaxID=3112167 RepID=UPI002DB73F3E|nr:PAS and ANTAR domain-containing protein [Nocardia sp. CDC153]